MVSVTSFVDMNAFLRVIFLLEIKNDQTEDQK